MKMCLAPCYKGCSDERYAEEAAAVGDFLRTRGESRLVTLRTERDQASANLEFESAASLHAQVQRVESVRALASELVRPMSRLRAVILQASAQAGNVAVFLFEHGTLRGPAVFSTLGMRIQNEQSGSTSLFAQPMAIEPTLEPSADAAAEKTSPTQLEARLEATLAALAETAAPPTPTQRQGHLALLKRWYYRPEVRRAGEIFFPDADNRWPTRAILRGVGRIAASRLKTPEAQPAQSQETKSRKSEEGPNEAN
jgi:excinuclease UvrABC nuclease subunit